MDASPGSEVNVIKLLLFSLGSDTQQKVAWVSWHTLCTTGVCVLIRCVNVAKMYKFPNLKIDLKVVATVKSTWWQPEAGIMGECTLVVNVHNLQLCITPFSTYVRRDFYVYLRKNIHIMRLLLLCAVTAHILRLKDLSSACRAKYKLTINKVFIQTGNTDPKLTDSNKESE